MEVYEPDEIEADVLPEGELVAGRYALRQPLGSGGMGTVYLAEDNVLGGEEVAIKILHRQLAFEKKYTQRFLREVQLMRKVNHPNVVRTYDVGADNDIVYFTMEFVPGSQLLDLIEKKQLPIADIPALALQIAQGLTAIHNESIIHRDLKPENILVLEDGTPKIADFGVARPEFSQLTAHNEVLGSSAYIAPEIWLGDPLTHSVDLYSFGVILYEAVTGRLPFEGDAPADLMRMHLQQEPVAPKIREPQCPLWLNKLILRLLEKSADKRPRGALAVAQTIQSIIEKSENGIPPEAQADAAILMSQLEEKSKRATDPRATMIAQKKGTKELKPEILNWNPISLSSAPVVRTIADEQRVQRVVQAASDALLPVLMQTFYVLLTFGMAVTCVSILTAAAGYVPSFSFEATLLTPEQQAPQLAAIFQSRFGAALYGIGHCLMLAMLLATPVVVLGPLSCSLINGIVSYCIVVAYFLASALILFLGTIMPVLKAGEVPSIGSITHAGLVIENQLIELALLSPVYTSFETTVSANSLFFHTPIVEPMAHSVTMQLLLMGYLALLCILVKRSFKFSATQVSLAFFVLVLGMSCLLYIESVFAAEVFREVFIFPIDGFAAFGSEFVFPFPVAIPGSLNWILYVVVLSPVLKAARNRREKTLLSLERPKL